MNYFTREELEDITKELLENPTRETLKKLNERFNGSVIDTPVEETAMVDVGPVITEPQPSVVEASMTKENVAPVVNPAPAFNIPNVQVPNVENNTNNVSFEMPNFELPKLETTVANNQNNQPVTFSGNLFEMPSESVANLMQTTDNFNSVRGTMPTTEVPVSPAPFFGPITDTISNPIPVGGPANTIPNIEPTMFGQLQQNYM